VNGDGDCPVVGLTGCEKQLHRCPKSIFLIMGLKLNLVLLEEPSLGMLDKCECMVVM
jgi:hypothetical protein